MEAKQLEVELSKGLTYVFETKEEIANRPSRFRRSVWQVIPSVFGTLMVLPYGLMLGWPSPMYPSLLKEDSPVPISMPQSAMVAGFLMIGNTIATPLSSQTRFAAKYGIVASCVLMAVGWVTMWQARDIFWLLGSRFLVGAGNGLGVGQLKRYIAEICQDILAQALIKQINLYILFGVILSFAFGPWVDFRQFSIISSIVSILVLFVAIFLPSTPRELMRRAKSGDAKKLIAFLSPHLDVAEEMGKIKERLNSIDEESSFCDVLKQTSLRKNFVLFAFLVVFQQFSGIPSTIVYSQIIFTRSHCPSPEFCALIYAFVYLLANAYGLYCISHHEKKRVLLFSCIGVSLLLLVKVIVLVERANDTFWNFTSLIVLLFYNVVHTIGLGSVPYTFIPDLFPKHAHPVMVRFFVMTHCMLALIITKIFQVLLHGVGLYAPFCLFLGVSTFSIIFVIVFVPSKPSK